MAKECKVYVGHILDAILAIESYVRGMTFDEFKNNDMTLDAVVRRFEIMGEAARQLPTEFKKNCPGIPWRDIADMRNLLIHEYFGVDPNEVWQTIKNDLPDLSDKLKSMI